MNILYFHQHFSTPKGATGIRSYQMARKLVELGHNVTMVCGSYNVSNTGLSNDFINGVRIGLVDGIRVVEFKLDYANSQTFVKRIVVFLKFAFKSLRLVFSQDFDLVVASSTPLTAAIPGIVAKIFRRKSFVFEVRDLWPELPREMGVIKNPIVLKLLSLLEWLSYKCADRIVALSPGMKDGILKCGVSERKVIVVSNGCDLDFRKVNTESSFRHEYGINPQDLVAVFSGTHGIANGLQVLMDSALLLKNMNVNFIKFVLVGDGKEKPRLVQFVKDNGLDNVIFIDPVTKDKLFHIYSECDIGLQILANIRAFYNGTSPNKFFDYISAGLPVLVNYPGWLSEFVDIQECGFIVQPERPDLLADTLIHAYSNRGLLVSMGANALDLAVNQFDRKKLASDWVEWVVNAINN